jgi:hypothetical protein
MGGGSMWALSYFGTKNPTSPVNNVPAVFSWRTEPHRSLMDIDMPEVLIGLKSNGKVYLDISAYCAQAGFRGRADMDKRFEPLPDELGRLLIETPDINLPQSLDHGILSVISTDMPPDARVFDSPYQWLGDNYGPRHGACLLLGKNTASGTPQKLNPLDAQPVIALLATDMPADLRLNTQSKAIEVKKNNRGDAIRKHPWLLRWLRDFSSNASKACGPDEFNQLTTLIPVNARLSLASEQTSHWVAASGCDGKNEWSLVITHEDETVSFLRLDTWHSDNNYLPTQVWTTDIDGDGAPEILIKGQYAEGWRYVILRVNTDIKRGHYLTEISRTAYHEL